MIDRRPIGTKFSEPCVLFGRWTGANANALVAVANAARGLKVTRTGVGTITLTLTDPPVGSVQRVHASVLSPNTAKQVLVTPPGATLSSPYQITMQVALSSNTGAIDVQSYEELDVEVWFAQTGSP